MTVMSAAKVIWREATDVTISWKNVRLLRIRIMNTYKLNDEDLQ